MYRYKWHTCKLLAKAHGQLYSEVVGMRLQKGARPSGALTRSIQVGKGDCGVYRAAGGGGGGEEVDGGRRAKEEARQRKEKKKKVREGTAEFVG